ncbi:hypothetical protein YB2330_005952 [Saitoella coloradoensis]
MSSATTAQDSTAAAPVVEVPIIQTASSTASVESSTADVASTESSDDAATASTDNVEAEAAAAEKEEKPFVPAPAPKVNIWKVRAEELAKRAPAPAPAPAVEEPVEEKPEKKEEKKDNEKKEKRGKKGSKSKKDDAKSEKKDEKKEEKTEPAAPAVAEPKPKKSPLVVYDESLPAPTSVPGAALAAAADLAFDDQSSFPTIDIAKSADQKAPKKTKKPTAKADKKEKWVSLTPTIVHATPLPGKGQRTREGAQGQQQQRGQRKQGQNREGGEQQQGKRVGGQRRGSQGAKKPQVQQQAQDKSAETAVEKKEEASDASAAAAPVENNNKKEEEEVVANGVNAQQQQPAQQQQQQQQRGPRPPRQFNNNNNRVNGGPMYTGAPQHQHHGQRRGGRMGGQYRGGWDMQAQMQQMQQWDMRPYILGQIDYYFSLDNLCKDLFLRRHMDGEGWVAVAFLANFNRVKQLTLDEKVVREACRGSQIVEVSVDGEKVRKREGWEMWVVPEGERLVFTRPAPVAVAPAAEEKKVEEEVKVNGVHEEEEEKKTEAVAEIQA